MSRYAVVEFHIDKSVDIVPVSWLSQEEDQCCWPPFKAEKISMLVKELRCREKGWKMYGVTVLGKAG
jgi:hypothetical protein